MLFLAGLASASYADDNAVSLLSHWKVERIDQDAVARVKVALEQKKLIEASILHACAQGNPTEAWATAVEHFRNEGFGRGSEVAAAEYMLSFLAQQGKRHDHAAFHGLIEKVQAYLEEDLAASARPRHQRDEGRARKLEILSRIYARHLRNPEAARDLLMAAQREELTPRDATKVKWELKRLERSQVPEEEKHGQHSSSQPAALNRVLGRDTHE